jgi:hypothetical protein
VGKTFVQLSHKISLIQEERSERVKGPWSIIHEQRGRNILSRVHLFVSILWSSHRLIMFPFPRIQFILAHIRVPETRISLNIGEPISTLACGSTLLSLFPHKCFFQITCFYYVSFPLINIQRNLSPIAEFMRASSLIPKPP